MTRMSLAERRQLLIEAALRVIGEQGVGAATTRAIAAEAGMPLASFHYAFESHQNLMGEAMMAVMGEEMARLRTVTLRGGSADEVIEGLLQDHLDDLLERTAVHRTVLELTDHALRSEGLGEVPLQWREQRAALLAEQLDRHLRAQGTRLDASAEDLAQFVLTLADGLTRAWLVTRDEALVRRVASAGSRAMGLVAA